MFIYFWERETEHEWGRRRERRKHRIWSRLQALSCQYRAQYGAQTYELGNHDLRWSQTLNQLSHRGAPIFTLLKMFIHFWERQHEQKRVRERGGQRVQSRLCSDISKPDVGLKLRNHEIMTWAEVGCSTRVVETFKVIIAHRISGQG